MVVYCKIYSNVFIDIPIKIHKYSLTFVKWDLWFSMNLSSLTTKGVNLSLKPLESDSHNANITLKPGEANGTLTKISVLALSSLR